MLIFYSDNFTLDLTYLQVTFIEENQCFSDEFTKEISFPFQLDLKGEFAKNSEFVNHYNAVGNKTVYPGKLDRDGEILNTILKIQQVRGEFADAIILTDSSSFPNFEKKLSALPLEQKNVANIIDDAEAVIVMEYPATNYNFPMVHTDKYDPLDEDWNGFGKIINHYKEGAFLENQLQEDSNIDLIKNIMQPMPYLMHVLHSGFADAGYTLAGDIIADPDLKRALLFRNGEYYTRLSEENIPFRFKNTEWTEVLPDFNGLPYVKFVKEIIIESKGDYIIFGDFFNYLIYFNPIGGLGLPTANVDVELFKVSGGTASSLYSWIVNAVDGPTSGPNTYNKVVQENVDVEVSFEVGDVLRLEKIEPRRDSVPSETPDYPETCSLDLIPIRYRNPDGSPIISVLNLTEIDLSRCVPDISFGDLITAIKNLKNYRVDIEGNIVYMNLIQPLLKRSAAVQLSDYEVEEPIRNYHEDRSFELRFKDGNKAEYTYDSVMLTASGETINTYTKKESTTTIEIDALPLPVIVRNGVSTAHDFEDETSKIRLLFYKPMLTGGSPASFDNPNILIPALMDNNWRFWLLYRVSSVGWNWDFIITVEKFREIKIQTMIYAFDNYHLFTEVEKQRLDHLWWRITAKTESLV